MGLHVHKKLCIGNECLWAIFTSKVLFTCMYFLMDSQIALLCKTSATELALVRLLTCMRPFMNSQVSIVDKWWVTETTFKWLHILDTSSWCINITMWCYNCSIMWFCCCLEVTALQLRWFTFYTACIGFADTWWRWSNAHIVIINFIIWWHCCCCCMGKDVILGMHAANKWTTFSVWVYKSVILNKQKNTFLLSLCL